MTTFLTSSPKKASASLFILFKIKEKEGQIIKTFEVIDRTKQRKIRKEKHDKQKTTK